MNVEAASAGELLSRHGRSFHLAAYFLLADVRDRATKLYAFCRLLDDLVDGEGDPKKSVVFLKNLVESLATSQEALADIYRSIGLADDTPARCFIHAMAADTESRKVLTLDELLVYSYGVAGTVGMMMADVLGCSSSRALPHALDLGIAMQLVNISRDVLEDAHRGRVYLPAEWLPESVSDAALRTDPTLAWEAVQKAIHTAEVYFESGFHGLHYLPQPSQRGIWMAGQVYREIGKEILRKGPTALRGRTVVPRWKKTYLVIKCRLTPRFLTPCGLSSAHSHDPILHRPLGHLYGAHQSQ